ncbi:hypothetical protein [Streptomyces rhizosphaericus]|uniref:Uncharacterized protein n=1 Tax=Streptomyces rhizosphaericus TaxID=114699 RepID=A0A6G4ACN3_9ACTN|nr:hypothetical protein [Streptomyces rhizosphaericus]NEW70594.1 hypothetical protein [Streptomyces rhizosphaericus]
MGASGWDYLTPYEGSVEATLVAVQRQVLASGDYIWPWETLAEYGATAEEPLPRPSSLDALNAAKETEEFWDEGTHTILDIDEVVHTTEAPDPYNPDDSGTLRPLRHERVRHHFGTDRPTPAQFEELLARKRGGVPDPDEMLTGECRMRWTGLYVVLYTDGEPSHLGIFGYSGD